MNVLVADKFADDGVAAMKEMGCNVTVGAGLQDDSLVATMRETTCGILIVRSTKVRAEMLDASSELRLVIRAGSGYDTIDVAAATQRGIRVCNCPGMNAVAVAELTIGLMIALDRRIVDGALDLRRGVWNKKEYGKARGLKGRTLGIVGLGRIGYEVAARARAFEMKLVYSDVIEHADFEKQLGIAKVTFEDLLRRSDVVTIHVPGAADTKHLIGPDQLAVMKPTAFLINCSRGGTVDEAALAQAIEKGQLGGAALDVYENEPGATDTQFAAPIKDIDKVYGTHHIGASTEQAQNAVAEEAVEIVRRFRDGGEFLHCVNPA